MSNRLSIEQIRACRDNPLAAYFAKRLPFVLGVVLTMSVACLMMLFIGMYVGTSPESTTNETMITSRVTTFLVIGMVIVALLLSGELYWMTKHKIFPETLADNDQTFEEESHDYVNIDHLLPETLERPLDMPPVKPARTMPRWREIMKECEDEAAQHRAIHRLAKNDILRDYHRSMELHWATLADLVEAGFHCLEDKVEHGYRGTGAGRRQLEMTRECFQRISRIAQQGCRKLWPKGQKKPLAKR